MEKCKICQFKTENSKYPNDYKHFRCVINGKMCRFMVKCHLFKEEK